jgi:cytidyltransferase-like protein
MLHVYLGRFAPFHDGHKMLLTKLIKKFGVKNCLVLIGSSNILDKRTPFTPEHRLEMVKKHFPDIKILTFPDVGEDELWLKNLKKLEAKFKTKFIFYGGSPEDLDVLARQFETHVLVNRHKEGMGISATKIRKSLVLTDLGKDIDTRT